MNSKQSKANNSIVNANHLSNQNSIFKTLYKLTNSLNMSHGSSNKTKTQQKMDYLTQQITLLQESKKLTLDYIKKKKELNSSLAKSTKNSMRTKLIPKEKFMNSTNVSYYWKRKDKTLKETEIHEYLDNELELLGLKNFEGTIKTAYESKQSIGSPDIIDHSKKPYHSPPHPYKVHRNISYIGGRRLDNHMSISPNNYIRYSKNASVPRTTKDLLTDKLNNSNMTLDSKTSEKSYNNNILFTDGGITNINIHGIIGCDNIPNEIYFNDKRYKCLQNSLTKTVQEDHRKAEVLKEMKRTIDILKCYIQIQQVFLIYIRMWL
jgi:hypothetical protein